MYAFCPIGVADAAGPSSSALPRRLWQSLALAAGVSSGDRWADVSKAKLSALAQQLTACDFKVRLLPAVQMLLVFIVAVVDSDGGACDVYFIVHTRCAYRY